MKFFQTFLILLFTLSVFSVVGQDVTGEWYGVGYVKRNGEHNSYLSEMVLKQKGNKVTGQFKYFFKRDSIKIKITGTYFPKYRRLELNASPILNFQAKNWKGADCPMEGGFNLMISKVETTLTGQFNPTYEYRITCPAINIKFVKFVPEPESALVEEEEEEDTIPAVIKVDTVKPTTVRRDTIPIVKKEPEKPAEINKDVPAPVTQRKDTVIAAQVARDTIKQTIYTKDTARQKIVNRDSIRRSTLIVRQTNPNEKFIRELYRRSFELVAPLIEVDADSLRVSFLDNGEIDQDTISVFINRKPALMRQQLSDKPVSLNIRLDTTVTEISMFAENLGGIAPNTAVAIIYAGEKRYELTLSSSFLNNSTMRFRRKPKHIDPKNIN